MNPKVTSESKALLINEKDNVGVALNPIPKGKSVLILNENSSYSKVNASDDIPLGHKIALKSIPKGHHIVKYGENMGIASSDINIGTHVHIHNVDSLRGKKRHK